MRGVVFRAGDRFPALEGGRRSLPPPLSLLVLAGLMAGCPDSMKSRHAGQPGAPGPAAGGVTLVSVKARVLAAPSLEGNAPDEAWTLAEVRRRLQEARGSLRLAAHGPQGAGGYRLDVQVGVGEDLEKASEGGSLTAVSLRAEDPTSLAAPPLQARALASLKPPVKAAEVRKAVSRLLDTTLGDLSFQADLATAGEQRLVEALERPRDVQRLAAALEMAAFRKARSCVPALVKLLRHDDESISDRAIGALVAMGDQRAVKPLTRLARFEDTAKLAKVLDAIAALGGEEARTYLGFVASGHDDEDIRNLAAEALQRMDRKQAGKAL